MPATCHRTGARPQPRRKDIDIPAAQGRCPPDLLTRRAAHGRPIPGRYGQLPPKGDLFRRCRRRSRLWSDKRRQGRLSPHARIRRCRAQAGPGIDQRVPTACASAGPSSTSSYPTWHEGALADSLTTSRWTAVVKSYQETKGLAVDGVIGGQRRRCPTHTTIDER